MPPTLRRTFKISSVSLVEQMFKSKILTQYDTDPDSNNVLDFAKAVMAINGGSVYLTLSDEQLVDVPAAKVMKETPTGPLKDSVKRQKDEDQKLRNLIRTSELIKDDNGSDDSKDN